MKRHAHAVWCVIAVASTSSAEVINVPAGQPTIQAGIDAASDGDVVELAPGTYPETIDFIGKAITLRSSHGRDVTTIDAQGAGSVVTCASGEGPDTVLEGFTITGGDAPPASDGGGGMVINDGSSPMVIDCTFIGNTADGSSGEAGGGMANFGSATVTNCEFIGNYASLGGGMYNSNSSLSVTGCTFSDNGAEIGGGLFDNGGGPVTDCTFTDNWAYEGGGLFGGDVVTNCTFRGNTAVTAGGGIAYCETVINCIFTENSAEYGGGTAHAYGGNTLRDCTFNGNLSPNGRAVALFGQWQHPGELVLANCILWDGGNETWTTDGTITVSYSNVQGGFGGTGNIDVDALFVDPAGGDLRLQPGSPCIDAGDNLAVPAGVITDLDGNPRFAHDPCTPDTGNPDGTNPPVDMGAYEFQPPCPSDLDCSGSVDVSDLLAILSVWGSCAGCPEDLNGDDAVAVGDLLMVLVTWGPCP